MTVREEVRERIERDALLAKLRKKIDSGKGTFADSFAYSDRAGKLLGDIFSRRLPDIPLEEREALCVELLRDRYTDINELCDRVQKALDEAQGLHLAPQHAPYNEERAHQIGSSLRDLSKPEETLQRRAESAPATATRAMHDDRMKAESKFRSRAGLKCTVNRVAAFQCCEWCDRVAGKYEYDDTPDDLWRRHDNCKCSIVYGTRRNRQVLRGTEKKWEVVADGVGVPDPVRLTPEQAAKLQAKKGLTIKPRNDTIKAIALDDIELRAYGKGIEKDVQKKIYEEIQELEKRCIVSVSDVRFDYWPETPKGKELIITEPLPNGLFRISFNTDAFSGLTCDEIDAIFSGSSHVLANSLTEAMIHESGHIKYMKGRSLSEISDIHKRLKDRHIENVSPYGRTDGAECIAEVEVLLYRGLPVPKEAMELYSEYVIRG